MTITITEKVFANAEADILRLDDLLAELRLEEQRCQLAKARLEAERTRVQAFVAFCNLAQKFGAAPANSDIPKFTIETRSADAKVVAPAKPGASSIEEAPTNGRREAFRLRAKRKPDGLPTVAEMVLAVLEGEKAGMRPCDITKVAQRKWWPDLRPAAVNAAVWKLAGQGRLEKDGRLYKLNGHADEG